MSENSTSTTRGFAILSIAGILSKLLSLLYVPMLQSIIGIEGYGIYAKTYEIFVFFYALTNLGMQTAIAKYVSELTTLGQHKDAVRTFKIARTLLLIVGTIITVILMVSADYVSIKSKNPNIVYGLMTLAPAVAITSVLCAYRGYFQGKNLMTPLAISTVLEQFFNVFVSLICAAFLIKYGVNLGSAGGTIGTSVGALLAVYFLIYVYYKKRLDREAYKIDKSKKRTRNSVIIKKLIMYGFPITLSAGLQNLGALIDMFIVNARLLSAGFNHKEADILYGVLGFYKNLLYVPLIIITALATAILPIITKSYVLKDRKGIKDNLIFTIRISFTVAIPAALALSMLSKEVYTVLFNTIEGNELMLYGSIVVVFMAMVQIQSTVLQSINKFYFLLVSLSIGIILKIISNYILVGMYKINIYGAVLGGILCFLIPMLINHKKICSVLKIRISLIKLSLKPIISSLCMGLVLYGTKYIFNLLDFGGMRRFQEVIPLTVLIILGGITYLYVMIYLGGIRKREINALSPRLLRMLPKFMKKRLR